MPDSPEQNQAAPQLEGGAYEIIQNRLRTHGGELRDRLAKLNAERQAVFGAVDPALVATERVTTQNACVPRDIIRFAGNQFLFGYNVHLGLKSKTELSDVFAIYEYNSEDHTLHSRDLSALQSGTFEEDLEYLYRYYKKSVFVKFMVIGPHLFMAFRIGESITDIKTFKWLIRPDGIEYIGNRFDHEYQFPPQREFEWKRAHRDMQRHGLHPHVSIEDRLFVETVGGDLTIKIEDNTDSGLGIYREDVTNQDQTLDDAEIFYACVGSLILLKILPFQERDYRFLVYNEKIKKVYRVPAIKDSCVLLPDDHGLIFANGYLLQTGTEKIFDTALTDMRFERRVTSPNGEDTLFVFYNRLSGDYILLSYNIISQSVQTPIICNGYTLFPNGELIYFKTEDEPQKHHVLQVWTTPYYGEEAAASQDAQRDSYLYRIGNADIVGCMAECQEILTLLGKEDTYGGLYLDLVKKTRDICDTYFWLDRDESFHLRDPLLEINQAAQSAIAEFDKVVRLRRRAGEETARVRQAVEDLLSRAKRARPDDIMGFVHILSELRGVRGELISLKEVRYVDLEQVAGMEASVEEVTETVSNHCVEFLQTDVALDPYRQQVQSRKEAIPDIEKVIEAEEMEAALTSAGEELDMLIEIVSNLKIEDATKTTQIIDDISNIYAQLNQVRVALKNRKKELGREEGEAQFNAQLRLLNQAVVNYLELCSNPEKCEEYLTKTMIQLEELEGQFSEFDEYIEQLAEKREEVYDAFETRKLSLTEARNKRAGTLKRSAERVLSGIRHRVAQFETINEINGFLASDLLIGKVRDIVKELTDMGDSVKADDLTTQLKTIHDEAVRQLKDRQELFVDGQNILQFGTHKFSVNTQDLELTVVPRDEAMAYHLTGTDYFEVIRDEGFQATREVWEQSVVSEDREVYRAEYLAYRFFLDHAAQVEVPDLEALQKFMGPRYAEGYTKGLHDHDAHLILQTLWPIHREIGLLRYSAKARALGMLFWECWMDDEAKGLLEAKLLAFGGMRKTFGGDAAQQYYQEELAEGIAAISKAGPLLISQAAEYLVFELSEPSNMTVSRSAAELVKQFETDLTGRRAKKRFEDSQAPLQHDPKGRYQVILEWLRGYLATVEDARSGQDYVEEAAVHLLRGGFSAPDIVDVQVSAELTGLMGTHPQIGEGGTYRFHYNAFMDRLRHFELEKVPRFKAYTQTKTKLVESRREELRLTEFKPRVMSSFVRNQLLDKVYLPLVGANLAKQIGTVGGDTRTDRMGLLLLISPPGYGKTTLMEYIANRLGITFMKVNGPAIGHHVTSLDPEEAPNASARQEIDKLNLALEMGDNVMIYLDDIQHCNPEFLQKFISLCDAQRKMEGVWQGKARTYDLRGKKVAVVMAGNPYTESGGKFQIPDMLANRADTYNLGDIIGGHGDAFADSFIENSLTSNPVLSKLAARSQKDVYAVMKIARTGTQEGVEFEGNYSMEEIDELTNVMKKLFRIRDTILRVNSEYIASASQQDAYRTEPAFRLQGSYRNMNRIAEQVLPIMTDAEVEQLIMDHYENESQNLTTGAEANLLKFLEMEGRQTEAQAARWEEIKKTFRRNQLMGAAGADDPVSRVVGQLASFGKGLEDIQAVLAQSGKLQFSETAMSQLREILRELRSGPAISLPESEDQEAPESDD